MSAELDMKPDKAYGNESYLYFAIAAVAVGLIIEIIGYVVEPDGGKGFIGFGVVYGWLAVFVCLSQFLPKRKRFLTAVAGIPLFLLAITSIVLSFPIYVLPAAIFFLATMKAENSAEG